MDDTRSMLWTLLEQALGRSNAILPDSYCQLIRRLLPTMSQELELLDATMCALDKYFEDISGRSAYNPPGRFKITRDILSPLLNKKAKLQSRVERLRMALAPHKYLPSQLWSDIFILVIGEFAHPSEVLSTNHRNPLRVLLAVCSRWRDIILDNQTLWREIEITRRRYNFKNAGLSWFVGQLLDRRLSTDAFRSARPPIVNVPTAPPCHYVSPSSGHARDILQRIGKSNNVLPEPDRQFICRARAVLERRLDIVTGIELTQRRLDRHLPESNLPAIMPYLHRERNWIMKNLQRFCIALAPQKNLPSELWSLIFQYVCYNPGTAITLPPTDFTKSPWNIYHACIRWRAIILADPAIWRNLIISDWGSKNLQNISLTGSFILRCKNLSVCPTEDPESRHQKCLTELLIPYGHTLVSLWLQNFDLPALVPLLQSSPGSFDNLESFGIETRADVQDEDQFRTFPNITFLRDAPKLSMLVLAPLAYPLFSHQTHHLPWSSLVRICVKSNVTTSLATILHTLRSCKSLSTCELICNLEENTVPPLHATRLPLLSWLDLVGSNLVAQLLGALCLPSLERVGLSCGLSGDGQWGPRHHLPFISLMQNSNCPITVFESDFYTLPDDIEELLESMPKLRIFDASISDFDVWPLVIREDLIREIKTIKIGFTNMNSLFDLLDSRQPAIDELGHVHGLLVVHAWYDGDDMDQRRAEKLRLRIREFGDAVKIKIICWKDVLDSMEYDASLPVMTEILADDPIFVLKE